MNFSAATLDPTIPSHRCMASAFWARLGLPLPPPNLRRIHSRWRSRNRLSLREINREYRKKNTEKDREYRREYRKSERGQAAWRAIYVRLRRDPFYRAKQNLRSRIYRALKGGEKKSAKTFVLLGCSPEHLKTHIEKQFRLGMNWGNYGSVWHIDHVRPCANFDLSDPAQQRDCFHFSNLQPLFAKENLSKGKTFMPNSLKPVEPTEVHPNPPPNSPWNYSVDEEVERQKALDRADQKIPNDPSRTIL